MVRSRPRGTSRTWCRRLEVVDVIRSQLDLAATIWSVLQDSKRYKRLSNQGGSNVRGVGDQLPGRWREQSKAAAGPRLLRSRDRSRRARRGGNVSRVLRGGWEPLLHAHGVLARGQPLVLARQQFEPDVAKSF